MRGGKLIQTIEVWINQSLFVLTYLLPQKLALRLSKQCEIDTISSDNQRVWINQSLFPLTFILPQ